MTEYMIQFKFIHVINLLFPKNIFSLHTNDLYSVCFIGLLEMFIFFRFMFVKNYFHKRVHAFSNSHVISDVYELKILIDNKTSLKIN